MIIQPTSLAALTWLGAASGTTAESWRIGVVLSARPLGVTEQGKMVLQIGGMTVEADTAGTQTPQNNMMQPQLQAQLPSQFQVRVLTLGSQPTLEVMLPQASESAANVALRERLPQQNGMAPLLATVQALSQRAMVSRLPPALRPLLAQLEQAMRRPSDLTTGAGLREAISRSGVFLESSLAQGAQLAAGAGEEDWKAVLLKLSSLLDSYAPPRSSGGNSATYTPSTSQAETAPPLLNRGMQAQPRLGAQAAATLAAMAADGDSGLLLGQLHTAVRAALARIEVAQLEASNLPAWIVEIPVKSRDGRDVLQLQMEYGNDADDDARQWTLGFALDLPTLGPVQGELQLNGLRLSVRLWAERPGTTDRLEETFAALRHRLAACGLLLDQLSCQTGVPPSSGRHSANLLKATA